jgi:hypothetical protein
VRLVNVLGYKAEHSSCDEHAMYSSSGCSGCVMRAAVEAAASGVGECV